LGGDFFLAAVLSTTLTKLAMKTWNQSSIQQTTKNLITVDVLLILADLLLLGQTENAQRSYDPGKERERQKRSNRERERERLCVCVCVCVCVCMCVCECVCEIKHTNTIKKTKKKNKNKNTDSLDRIATNIRMLCDHDETVKTVVLESRKSLQTLLKEQEESKPIVKQVKEILSQVNKEKERERERKKERKRKRKRREREEKEREEKEREKREKQT